MQKNDIFTIIILMILIVCYLLCSDIASEKFSVKQSESNTLEKYKFTLKAEDYVGIKEYGRAIAVNKNNFQVLKTFTSFYVEIYNNSMRTPHLHDCEEFGFVSDGTIEIMMWNSENEYTSNIANKGDFWFIPKGVLHSLNNLGNTNAILYVGFNSPDPTNIDIAIVLNGLPQYLKNQYAGSPHSLLKNYNGPTTNYYFNKFNVEKNTSNKYIISQYVFDSKNIPYYYNEFDFGNIKFINKYNWYLLNNISMSSGLFELKAKSSTFSFWYTNADVLYIIIDGHIELYVGLPDMNNNKIILNKNEYFFMVSGTPHVINNISNVDSKILAYYSTNDVVINKLGQSFPFFNNSIMQNVLVSNSLKTPLSNNENVMKYQDKFMLKTV